MLQELITKKFSESLLLQQRKRMNEERDLPRLTEIGIFLKNLRKLKGLSQDELAARCDLTKSNISNIENGKKDFNFTTFLEYAKGLKLHPKELLNNDFEFPKSYLSDKKVTT